MLDFFGEMCYNNQAFSLECKNKMLVWLSCVDTVFLWKTWRIRNAQVTGSGPKQNEKFIDAGVAQLVEQRIRNAQVIGSSPITSLLPSSLWRGLFIL